MTDVPLLVRFDGGPTEDGKAVIVSGRLANNSQVRFSVETKKISWIVGKLAEWTREAASKASWRSEPIAQQDDTGIWMRPTQYGLLDVKSDNVHLAIDVGPVRFRFAFERLRALELGQVLQAAAALQNKSN